jgi:TetR/AcrR family transcriptional regulator, copper-responsive repressor
MVQNSPKRRGRPRAYDPEAALDRARDAFWEAGYAATSLDTLAAATGMNRPSLYLAFGDKRALYRHTLERYRAFAREALADALSPERTLRDALASVFRRAIALYLSGGEGGAAARGCLLISTAVPEAATDPELRAYLREAFAHMDATFAARMRLGRERGELPEEADPEALGRLAASLMYSLSVRARAGATREELERIAADAIGVLLGPAPA